MEALNALKKYIRRLAQDDSFVHKEWFVTYHLEIAEKLAMELCDLHKEADRNLVTALVWFHDYGKIIDFPHEHQATQDKGLSKLLELGFEHAFAEEVIQGIKLIDEKTDLPNSSIEVRIASSADGASHLIGPFYLLYWREHPDTSISDLVLENRRKLEIDWNKKIVLPEVRRAFKDRYHFLKEQFGEFTDKLL
jgi:hypothetical protein